MDKFEFKINDKVEIVYENNVYKSMIQEINEDNFFINIPIKNDKYMDLKKDTKLRLHIYEDNGAILNIVCVIEDILVKDRIRMYRLSNPIEMKKLQRRNDVRVSLLNSVAYYKIKTENKNNILHEVNQDFIEYKNGVLINLSAGGLGLKSKNKLEINDKIFLNIDMTYLKMNIIGEVVRIEDSFSGVNIYGIRFEDLNDKDSERIIRSVFTIMRKQKDMI